MQREIFIRKLNNTELNNQTTNDAYIRVSSTVLKEVPVSFFETLNSQSIKVIDLSTKRRVDNWVRFQFYPSNGEHRIANLSSIYKNYHAEAGDKLCIRKVQIDSIFHYEIYMVTYEKLCFKYSKSNKAFEILNENSPLLSQIGEQTVLLNYGNQEINSRIKIKFSKKKRTDSPSETNYYSIDNLTDNIYSQMSQSNYLEITSNNESYNLCLEKSWSYTKIDK